MIMTTHQVTDRYSCQSHYKPDIKITILMVILQGTKDNLLSYVRYMIEMDMVSKDNLSPSYIHTLRWAWFPW